jgi:uncharacterized protein (DUF983 family)
LVTHSKRRKLKMEFSDKQISEKTLSPYIAGLLCRCPRCGKGKLFAGFLTLKSKCDVCGLDFSFADAGDGPAIFVIMIAGAIVVGAALVTEVKYQPPYWVHAVLWIPLILIVTLWPLRGLKSLLIALQYHHKASQGKLRRRSSVPTTVWGQPRGGRDASSSKPGWREAAAGQMMRIRWTQK